jgi:hypothetical protein
MGIIILLYKGDGRFGEKVSAGFENGVSFLVCEVIVIRT